MELELWIARDKDNETLWLFFDEPKLDKDTMLWKGTKLYCGASSPGLDKHKEILPELTFENSPQKVALNLLPQTIKEGDECLEPITYIGYQKLFKGFKVGDEVMTAKGSKGVKTTINGFVKIATGNGKEEIKARTTHGWIAIDQLVKIK